MRPLEGHVRALGSQSHITSTGRQLLATGEVSHVTGWLGSAWKDKDAASSDTRTHSLAHFIPNIPSCARAHICYLSQEMQGQMSRHSYPFWVGTVFEEECVSAQEEGAGGPLSHRQEVKGMPHPKWPSQMDNDTPCSTPCSSLQHGRMTNVII